MDNGNGYKKDDLLKWMKGEKRGYPSVTICDGWYKSLKENYDEIAIRGIDRQITYQELEERSNIIALKLKEQGIKKADVVAIILGCPKNSIAAQLAVLKLNGVCLNIEKNHPRTRLEYMLNDSNTKAVICDDESELPDGYNGILINYSTIRFCGNIKKFVVDDSYELSPAYLIYTSGTTGRPKGTVLSNKGIMNHLYTKIRVLGLGKGVVVSRNFSVNSVAAVWQTFVPLLIGGTIAVHNHDTVLDGYKLFTEAEKLGVNIISMVPSQLSSFIGQLEAGRDRLLLNSLKMLVLTGEKTEPGLVKRFYKFYHIQLWNAYGQSECSDDTLHYKIKRDCDLEVIPIGKPSDNTCVYIMDKNLNIQPVGVEGEICISGDGVALGYLHSVSDNKFIENPYDRGTSMYKTGDIGRWNFDGDVEYIGRIDRQVELRGFRVELEEIEACIAEVPGITGSVVVTKGNHKEYLYAYVLSCEKIAENELKKALKEKLPEHMLPARIIQLDKFPMTSTGKVDLLFLESREDQEEQDYHSLPRNKMDRYLCSMWRELLKRDFVGIDDDFFSLGGNSLKATSLIYKLNTSFGTELNLGDLFHHPTVRWLSDHLILEKDKNYKVITREEDQKYYPLSLSQNRIFILNEVEKEGTQYNISGAYLFKEKIDLEKLSVIWSSIIQRHEAFRTRFEVVKGVPMQCIEDTAPFKIVKKILPPGLDDSAVNLELQNFIKPFDLTAAPLLRVGIFELDEKRSIMIYDMHHIIADGASLTIIYEEFLALYRNIPLDKLTARYRDFILWQQKFISSARMEGQKEYWLSQLSGGITALDLPFDKQRPLQQSFRGATIRTRINKEEVSLIKRTVKEEGITLFTFLLSSLNILLYKYTKDQDIIIGTPVLGRYNEETKSIVGMFVNTIALKCHIDPEDTLNSFFRKVMCTVVEGYDNQDYPFDELVNQLKIPRDRSRNPIFDIMLLLHEADDIGEDKSVLNIEKYPLKKQAAQFDLTFEITEDGSGLYVDINYCADIFNEATIRAISGRFIRLMQIMAADRDLTISQICISTRKEQQWVLEKGKGEIFTGIKGLAICQMLQNQAENAPNDIALAANGIQVSYAKLWERIEELKAMYRKEGMETGQVVVIQMTSSIELILSILSVLSYGAICLPIDVKCPKQRKKYMIEDSCADWVITYERENILLERNQRTSQECIKKLNITNVDNQAAYIIYTSGSTGLPKGVILSEKGILNHAFTKVRFLNMRRDDVVYHNFSINFVASIWQYLAPLITGARVVIQTQKISADAYQMLEEAIREKVSILSLVPSQLDAYLDQIDMGREALKLNTIKCVILTGEKTDENLVRRFYSRYKIPLINAYGLSECSDDVLHYRIPFHFACSVIPIGSPAINTQIYILGDNFEILPAGVQGEIYIGGDSLALGYIRDSADYASKFIKVLNISEKILFRTGDIGRWNEDGYVEYLGRKDRQVKIRGHRIELEEIGSCLKQNFPIEKTATVIQGKENNEYICCYVICKEDISELDMKDKLREYLPEYMIPNRIIKVDAFPTTISGKINYGLLENYQEEKLKEEFHPPQNELEEELCELWMDLLTIDRVSITDDFFELGGNSLKCSTLLYMINDTYHSDLELDEIFMHPTVKWLAERIQKSKFMVYEPIIRSEFQDVYPLSLSQKRIYILDSLVSNNDGIIKSSVTPYNISYAFTVYGELEVDKLQEACQELVNRHDVLRTRFSFLNEEPVQIVIDRVKMEMAVLSANNGDEQALQEILRDFIHPFDLKKPPLIRIGLISFNASKHILVFDMHHIISDGFSLRIIFQDLLSIYSGDTMYPQKVQYHDFVLWQQKQIQRQGLESQKRYWVHRFRDSIPVLHLLEDQKRPLEQSFKGELLEIMLNKEKTSCIKNAARRERVTVFTLLLSGLYILLHKYSGDTDIVVGSAVSGRLQQETKSMVGMFVNTIALRNQIQPNDSFTDFLQAVKLTVAEGYTNQAYPFEELVEELNIPRNRSRNPIFDVMMLFHEASEYDTKGFQIEPYHIQRDSSQFDLTFEVTETEAGLKVGINYCTDIFNKESVKLMMDRFIEILIAVSLHRDVRIRDLSIVSTEARQWIIEKEQGEEVWEYLNQSIDGLIEKQVQENADKTALISGEIRMSYLEFWNKVLKLSEMLVNNGIKNNDVVIIQIKSSIELFIAITAVLKSNGVCLPIEADCPQIRFDYIRKNSSAVGVLLYTDHRFNFEKITGNGKSIRSVLKDKESKPAYIIYTSGTSGNPKGVLLSHQGIVNHLIGKIKETKLSENDIISQSFGIRFVASIWQFAAPLCCGSAILVHSDEVKMSPYKLLEEAQERKASIISMVPFQLKMYLDMIANGKSKLLLESIRLIILTGEKTDCKLVEKFNQEYKIPLLNAYGQSECSDDTLHFHIPHDLNGNCVPIGKPAINTQVYILDEAFCRQPVGIPGEIYIAGKGLAMGYINNNELNSQKFLKNPFLSNSYMYRTGDYGRWNKDGNVEYLGRKDRQIKIRGIRLEPEEIEHCIEKFPGIERAVVVEKREDDNRVFLCAYVLSKNAFSETKLLDSLRDQLPEYMIPHRIIRLESFPQTSSGKTDLRELEDRKEEYRREVFTAPKNAVEKNICNIVEKILHVNEISIDDNFFDLGGNSLTAVQLSVLLEEQYRNLRPSYILSHPTVRSLAAFINKETVKNNDNPISNYCEDKKDTVLIENIKPFGDLFYKNCFYNSLFPVLYHFKRDIMQVLLYDSIIYNFNLQKNQLINYKNHLSTDHILIEMNVKYEMKSDVDEVVETIIYALGKHHPVILWIDCYKISVCKQEYRKKHVPHTILLYGYNNNSKTFYIIDHINEESNYYKMQEIPYHDVKEAYNEYQVNFNQHGYHSFYEFYQDETRQDTSIEFREEEQRKLFYRVFNEDRDQIKTGFEDINKFKQYFIQCVKNKQHFSSSFDNLIGMMNDAVNSKKAELFRNQRIFQGYKTPGDLSETILEQWILVRTVILKQKYSDNKIISSDLELCLRSMDRIYQLESLNYDIISEYENSLGFI